MSPIQTITGKPLGQFIRDNLLLMLGVAIVISAWVLIYAFAVHEPKYAAKSTVIIKDSAITSRYVEPDQYYALQTTSSNSANPVLNTMGLLKSNAISDDLYEYLRTKRPAELKRVGVKTKAQWEQFFQDGASFIKSKNTPGTDLIAIQFTWSNPVIAKEGLEVILKSFQETSLTINKAEQTSRSKFLYAQVNDISEQLETVRKEKSLYKKAAGTINISSESESLATTRMELSNKLNQTESEMQGKLREVAKYQQMLGMNTDEAIRAAAIGQNGTLSKLQDELYRLSQQYANLSTNLTDKNPKVLEVKAQIDEIKQDIETETLRTLGASKDRSTSAVADTARGEIIAKMVAAQADATRLGAETGVMQKRLSVISQDIAKFPAMEEELANIQQRETSLSNALDVLRQKVIEARLKEEQTLSNVFIVDQPNMPSKANFPTQTHLVVLGLLLGAFGGVASAVIKEQFFGSRTSASPLWMQPVDVEAEESEPTLPQPEEQPIRIASVVTAPAYTRTNREPAVPTPSPLKPQPAAAASKPVITAVGVPIVGNLYDSLMTIAEPVKKTDSAGETYREDLVKPVKPREKTVPVVKTEPEVVVHEFSLGAEADEEPRQPAPKQRLEDVAQVAFVPAVHSVNYPQDENTVVHSNPSARPQRRPRSLPAFLMDEKTIESVNRMQPSPAGPETMLAAGDDLMQDVPPLPAPRATHGNLNRQLPRPSLNRRKLPGLPSLQEPTNRIATLIRK